VPTIAWTRLAKLPKDWISSLAVAAYLPRLADCRDLPNRKIILHLPIAWISSFAVAAYVPRPA